MSFSYFCFNNPRYRLSKFSNFLQKQLLTLRQDYLKNFWPNLLSFMPFFVQRNVYEKTFFVVVVEEIIFCQERVDIGRFFI